MSSLDDVAMSEDQYNEIFVSKWSYRWWAFRFYLRNPGCIWRDLWWFWMPGETVYFSSHKEWSAYEFERWCWRNVGIRHLSWDIKVDNWVKDEGYEIAVKIRKGKTKCLSHLTLVAQ